jgi:hypothetical protein
MGSRERRRAQRRKRKERSTERAPEERPTVVTVAAVISAALALGTVLAYAIGLEVGEFDDFGNQTGESRPAVFPTVVSTMILSAMAYGLWRARYWAVLGFQTLLVLVLVVAALGLAQVTEVWRALVFAAILGLAGFLFYRMVKAMARIQMPERNPPA